MSSYHAYIGHGYDRDTPCGDMNFTHKNEVSDMVAHLKVSVHHRFHLSFFLGSLLTKTAIISDIINNNHKD